MRDSLLPTVEGYEVLRRLGRGGMGEVLEAERIGPEGFRKRVALKQLALDLSIDRTAVSRFFQEARICARLEHPNIVRVQDLLTEGGRPFIVMELLRGLTLWELCRALPGRIEWWVPFAIAEQVLAALVYAHALAGDDGTPLGLVHRDLTPRNLMVTEDGVVKVLDFGIAKLTASFSTPALTADGSVAGTLEFFSPEQAQALPLDARSDLFQLGGSMAWALTGLPPNGTGTPAEVLARAVMGPGPKLGELRPDLPDGVIRFLERATARAREQRFADARAMHAELRAVLATTEARGPLELSALVRPHLVAAPREPRAPAARSNDQLETEPSRGQPRAAARAKENVVEPAIAATPEPSAPTSRRVVLTGVAASLAVGSGAFFAGRASVTLGPRPARRPPEFARLTWRQGTLFSARFTSDDSYVASGAFGNEPTRTWLGIPGTPEGRELEFGTAEVLAVSPQQELSLLGDVEQVDGFVRRGTLAQVMLSGGVPRDVLSDVQWVDYHPETANLAVVRWKGEQTTLEYPLDTVRRSLESGWFGELRFSPNGRWLAFIVHPTRLDESGAVSLLDVTKDGPARTLGGGWASLRGLAWRDSRTLWVTGSRNGSTRELHALDVTDGVARLLDRAPASLRLFDLRGFGRALIARESLELTAAGKLAGEPSEHELTLFDGSSAAQVSTDGSRVLLGERAGEAVGNEAAVYLRQGSASAVRLGTGVARDLSPDGAWALVTPVDRLSVVLLPTGPGSPRTFPLGDKRLVNTAAFFPDGRRLLVSVGEGTRTRFVAITIDGGQSEVLPIEGFAPALVLPFTPDGRRLALVNPKTELLEWVEVTTGRSEPVLGARVGETALRVSSDGQHLFVAKLETRPPLAVVRLEVTTGARHDFLSLSPADGAGVESIPWAVLSGDGSAYAYTYHRALSTLYLLSGAD